MEGVEKYDPALLGILQNEGQIVKFLDVILGFLYRRTDYFILMKSKTDKLGFPPGVAAKLLLTAYKNYEDIARKVEQEKSAKLAMEQAEIPAAVETVEIVSEPALPKCSVVEIDDSMDISALSPNTQTKSDKEKPPTAPSTKTTDAAQPKGENNSEEGSYQADSECYNGAVRDTYSWSQSITDCDIRVKVPPAVKKGANVKAIIKKKSISVSYKDGNGEWVKAMDGSLTWDIRAEEAIWSLVPGEYIHINLEKIQERWWEAVLEGEAKINVRKIDASRPYTDLDDESQAKISEMMYNEQQKRLGLPQSHETSTHDMLKKAWNAKGSPFAGQPFDPSKVSVNPSGMIDINTK